MNRECFFFEQRRLVVTALSGSEAINSPHPLGRIEKYALTHTHNPCVCVVEITFCFPRRNKTIPTHTREVGSDEEREREREKSVFLYLRVIDQSAWENAAGQMQTV